MARGDSVVRQWTILQKIEASRLGVSVSALAKHTGVAKRTIWRDVEALQKAGFPLYDTKVGGETRWLLNQEAFRGLLQRGLTLGQLCALYFSRALVECLADSPFHAELKAVFEQFERALPDKMRQFLDRLPAHLGAKPGATRTRDPKQPPDTVGRLVDATLNHRQVSMRYHSFSSARTKEYTIHPYRIVYAEGGLYLFAYVPEYDQVRTFAVERIKTLTVQEQSFEPPRGLAGEVFPHSLGAGSGPPQRIDLEFDARVAPYVRERRWHRSQATADQPDGSLRLTLEVCDDWPLRSWLLSFGPLVRVLSPAYLAEDILEELDRARDLYAPRMDFEVPLAAFDRTHPRLPLRGVN